jgi:alkylhydroperoxidase family enzyme
MKDLYPIKVQKAVEALLTTSGVCSPALRQAIEAHAVKLSGGDRETQPLPAELILYVDKVTLYAHKVTDQDVQQLIEAGYSEDAIFEITLCASVGASLARLERGMKALEASHALTNP